MFLRRGGSGEPWIDVHSLARGEGGWRLLGGGSGTADDSLFTDERAAAVAADFACNLGGGGTVLNADRLMEDVPSSVELGWRPDVSGDVSEVILHEGSDSSADLALEGGA